MNTAIDEQGHPIGLALSGMLVLRNLARQMLKIDEQSVEEDEKLTKSLIEQHFALHRDRIFEIMSFNYSLRHYAPEFVKYVSKGMERAYNTPKLMEE